MEPLRIATVQFETRDNDKMYNLSVIRDMCRKASVEGADVVAFHECSVCGYTFAKDLSYEELLAIAEPVPTGQLQCFAILAVNWKAKTFVLYKTTKKTADCPAEKRSLHLLREI